MNIAQRIELMAKRHPNKKATLFPKRVNFFGSPRYEYSALTFQQLDQLSSQFAQGLLDAGLQAGDKTLLFIKPCLEFHALVFALFKAGIVPVLIDPGMGKDNLLKAIQEVKPKGLIAEPIVHFLKWLYPSQFQSIKVSVSNRSIPFSKIENFHSWKQKSSKLNAKDVDKDELAAILFTSGGTGKPKGVEYTHFIFDQQTSILQEMFDLTEKDVDLPGFPLFSLFTLAMGMSSCIPDMNPSKPAKCQPAKLVQNILDTKATFLAGSPAIWNRVGHYCAEKNIQLPSVRALAMFGAPVSNKLHLLFQNVLINGTTYTPYGATESLPVSNISGKEVLAETAHETDHGLGTCIGTPAPHIEIQIIKISDEAIQDISEVQFLDALEKGEIIVKGHVATKAYHQASEATRLAKIQDGESFWHRMGDIGYKDSQGRLWFCGRKTHRVETKTDRYFPTPIESIFNNHPNVMRSALIGIGRPGEQTPAIVIQADKKQLANRTQFSKELKDLAQSNDLTKNIDQFYFTKEFPVDIRHNIKIDRLKLKAQAERGQL